MLSTFADELGSRHQQTQLPGGLFLDRDGTVIVHIPYLHDPRQVVVVPGAADALAAARRAGFRLYLFTNQSGVGRGLFGRDFPKENRKNFALNRQPGRDDSTEQTCTFSRRPAPARPKKTASTLVRSVADSKMTAFPTGLAATSPCKMTRLFPSIPCMTSSKLLVEGPRRRRADFGRSILLVATPPDR